MNNRPITLEARKSHRRKLAALVALLALLTAGLIGFQRAADLIAEGQKGALFGSDFWQAVGLQSGIAFATTALATVLITLTLGAYQDRMGEAERQRRDVSEREGIIATFESDSDPQFTAFLRDHITRATDEIRAVGLGLGFLAHNGQVLDLIAKTLNERKKLTVTLQYGSEKVPGVTARVDEEEEWNILHDIEYDRQWVTRYPNTIRDRIRRGLNESSVARLKTEPLSSLPMTSILAVDDVVLLSWYGTPAMRGSETPWVAISRRSATSRLASFVDKTFQTLDEE